MSSADAKDAADASGWLRSVPVAEGTLPHEVAGWEVFDGTVDGFELQPGIVVTARE